MWDPYAEFESATLPNGLSVHAVHWSGRPWERIGFLIHSGAEHDPVGLEGTAHFVEHLVSENSSLSKTELEEFFEGAGGGASFGATNYKSAKYTFFVPIDRAVLTKAFSLFGHMLLSAKLEKSIERERQVIIGEFYREYPIKFKLDMDIHERKMLYAGHWLERFVSPLGHPESVGRITQRDLQSYYDAHYTPANISIVGVGGMQLSELVDLLSESPFAMSKKGVRTALPEPATDVAPPLETRYVFEISEHLTTPVDTGGYRSVAKIPHSVSDGVIGIIKIMLDEVLHDEVRVRRAWTYSIGTSWRHYGRFSEGAINCSTLAPSAMNDIEAVVEMCIASIGERGELFEQLKRRALASNSMIDVSGRDICDGALTDLATKHRIVSCAESGRNLERVMFDEVRSALKWLHPERRWTLIVNP